MRWCGSWGYTYCEKYIHVAQDSILYRKQVVDNSETLHWVLLGTMWDHVLHSFHNKVQHLGLDRTIDLIQLQFCWPCTSKDVGLTYKIVEVASRGCLQTCWKYQGFWFYVLLENHSPKGKSELKDQWEGGSYQEAWHVTWYAMAQCQDPWSFKGPWC